MNSIAYIISSHRKEKKWTLMELCERLNAKGINIKHKAISAWESGAALPSVPTFFALCEIFEIRDVYEEVFNENPYNVLSKLNDEGKRKAHEYIELLLKDDKYTKSESTVDVPEITDISDGAGVIRLYDMPVSAGTGNFLEESTYADIPRTEAIPSGATFGVRISGDSMLPHYQDGQTVWVKAQSTLDNGEIGIFLLNGNAYCKKFRNTNKGTSLISLNKAYSPLPVTELDSFRIFGKVLN